MNNNKTNPEDFPFADLLGLKKKEQLTPEQEIGRNLMRIANEHNQNRKREPRSIFE